MDKVQYLLGVNKEEVYKTWKALGSLTINENVLYYTLPLSKMANLQVMESTRQIRIENQTIAFL